jgi:FHS family L-fucose permease-like MFS transporter
MAVLIFDHTPVVEDRLPARLFGLMIGVFLGGGLLASVEALLVPRLKLTLDLGYAEALLVQLVYYLGYLLFAVPATIIAARLGALRATAAGLAMMAAGCLLVALAQASAQFATLLAALLLLSSGVTVLQIACNGIMATLGSTERAVTRFTLLQGFNALGTVVGPLAAAWFLLGGGTALAPFLAFATGFAALAIAFLANGEILPRSQTWQPPSRARLVALCREPRIVRGTAAIFAYVGAEVTIGTLAVNYLMLPGTLGADPLAAGRLVSLYWMGAMVGRFAGAGVLRRMSAPTLLAWAAAGAVLLVAIAIVARGAVGGIALLAVGLCNSIMFPTIYALTMPTRDEDVPTASMLLCMAVVGGAVIPMATGLIADRTTLAAALAVPALCYGAILLFARGVRA